MADKRWQISKIQGKHVLQAAKIWKTQGAPGFKNSQSFDVIINGERFPPKAIASLAHQRAAGHPVPSDAFSGKKGGVWHRRFRELGFRVQDKEGNDIFDFEVKESYGLTEPQRATYISKAQLRPKQTFVLVERYPRSPHIVAERLRLSHGICDKCKKPAPFTRRNGLPGLEVHHIQPLSREGEDKIENTEALCPNCHSELHDHMALEISYEE